MKIRSGTQAAYPLDAIHKLELRQRGQGRGDVIFARYKKTPFGTTLIDREKWRDPGASQSCNLVKIQRQGSVRYESLVCSGPARSLAGNIIGGDLIHSLPTRAGIERRGPKS